MGGASDDRHSGCVPSKHQEPDAARRELRDLDPYADNRRIRGKMHECDLGSIYIEVAISFVLQEP